MTNYSTAPTLNWLLWVLQLPEHRGEKTNMEPIEPHRVSRAEIKNNQLTVSCFCGSKECLRIKRHTHTITNTIVLLKQNSHMYQTFSERLKLQNNVGNFRGTKNLTHHFSFLSTAQSAIVTMKGGGSLKVRTPAQIHLTEQFFICGFLD